MDVDSNIELSALMKVSRLRWMMIVVEILIFVATSQMEPPSLTALSRVPLFQ